MSSATGEVVLDTTRRERWWNYAGSVTHWIYPTALRSNWAAWDRTVWWLSLVAMIGVLAGVVLGTTRIKVTRPPHRDALSRLAGLAPCARPDLHDVRVTWIFSGWLSMDHGRLFSRGFFTDAEATAVTGAPAWDALAGG